VEDEDYDPENDIAAMTTPVHDHIKEDIPETSCHTKKNLRKKSHKRKKIKKSESRRREKRVKTEKLPKKEQPSPELRNQGSFQEPFQNSFEIPVLETMSYTDEVLSESSSFQILESVDNSDTSEPRWESDDWDVLPSLEHIDQLFSEDVKLVL